MFFFNEVTLLLNNTTSSETQLTVIGGPCTAQRVKGQQILTQHSAEMLQHTWFTVKKEDEQELIFCRKTLPKKMAAFKDQSAQRR